MGAQFLPIGVLHHSGPTGVPIRSTESWLNVKATEEIPGDKEYGKHLI